MNKSDPKSHDICVDASLWIRWLTKEPTTDETKKLFLLWLDDFDFFVAPSLLVFEIHSAFRKKYKRGEISPDQIEEALKTLSCMPVILHQSFELFRYTQEWAEKLNETVVYDVSYLALAAWQKAPFYTCDERFFEKAKGYYGECYLV